MDTEENVWRRITSLAPASVITSSRAEGADIISRLLETYGNEMAQRQMKYASVCCSDYQTALGFWQALAANCCQAVADLQDSSNSKTTERYKSQIEQAQTTDMIQHWLHKYLDEGILRKTGWHMLVTLEDFDALVAYSSSADLMKLRPLIEMPVIFITLSRRELSDLCKEMYGNPYFSNQFEVFQAKSAD